MRMSGEDVIGTLSSLPNGSTSAREWPTTWKFLMILYAYSATPVAFSIECSDNCEEEELGEIYDALCSKYARQDS